MNATKQILSSLSEVETAELKTLSKQLFGNSPFVSFSKEEMQTQEFKRYDELIKKKLERIQSRMN
jgi:hypothetical protein